MSFFAFIDFANSHSNQGNSHSEHIITGKSKFYKKVCYICLTKRQSYENKITFSSCIG
jgi:hypothetical protein